MPNDKKKNIIIVSIILLVVIYYAINTNKNEIKIETISSDIETEVKEEQEEKVIETKEIVVHVSGAVENEGIVVLEQGERISDAIEKAGGSKEEADLSKINLAQVLQDGVKVHIPSINDTEEIYESYESIQGGNMTNQESGLVNINTATQSQLEELPGIGPSTALKIIEYIEENGKFSKIEDVQNVSGIGESKYNSMKDFIMVE